MYKKNFFETIYNNQDRLESGISDRSIEIVYQYIKFYLELNLIEFRPYYAAL